MDLSLQSREFDQLDSHSLVCAKSWQEKYKLLMTWGGTLSVKPWLRQDDYLVRGCDTSLWLFCATRANGVYFAVDGESRIIKGLAALLLSQIDGASKEEILAMDLQQMLHKFELSNHLAPSRNNGFRALVNQVVQSVQMLDS